MGVFVVSMLLVFGFPFIKTDVVDSFETCKQFFLKEQPPVIPGILEKSVSINQNQYKIICQKYNKISRFATFYDTTNKIPLFSAYKFTGHTSAKRQRDGVSWKVELQLEDLKVGMSDVCSNQACKADYKGSKDLNRGHLFPCSHAADLETIKSTFTLTNAVPQYMTFNGGSWNRMEQKVRGIMTTKCIDQNGKISAYVLTGAVPNTKTPPEVLNNRVNIPSHMWTVFCCFNSESKKYESQAHWAENIDESNEKGKTIREETLKKLQDFLKSKYNKEISLFNGDCLDPVKADASPAQEADGCDDEPDVRKQSWWLTIKNLPADFWAWLRG